jgi:hypothetical protein
VAALDEIQRHGLAHDAQTDKADVHVFLLNLDQVQSLNAEAQRKERGHRGIESDDG